MRKKVAAIIESMSAEREALIDRNAYLDGVFCSGNGSENLEVEYYANCDRINELRRLIHEAGQPNRKICPNTQALVSANID